nr:PREDICTED: uncharacterized protein LOC108224288 [Daucus carota subsp. sativus]
MATTTLLNAQSTTSSSSLPFKIFSSISIFSALSALSFLSATTFHNTYLTSYTYIISTAFIAIHLILFPFHQSSRNVKVLQSGLIKHIATPAAYFVAFDLYFVPEKTVNGLWLVICIWIDVNALIQITRPVKLVKHLPNFILMVITGRAVDLYGFTTTYWMIMFFCIMVISLMDIYGNKISSPSRNVVVETKCVGV